MSSPLSDGDLVERSSLIETTVASLRGRARSRGVLLVGTAGVGLTALASAIVAGADDVVEWTRRGPPDGDPMPQIALVDDVHLIENSGDLEEWLERSPTRQVIATARSGALIPDPVAALWSAGRIERVDVPVLSPLGVQHMAETMLGGTVTRGLNEHLVQASEGLPLFVRELIADARADGTMIKSGESWVWWGDTATVGPRLRDLVRSRAEARTPSERAALDLVAVSGGAPLRILRQLIDDDDLDHCELAGLIRSTDEGILEVHPPAQAGALAASLSGARRASLRRRLSEVISGDPDVPDELVQRAGRWSIDEGIVPIPELAIAAAAAANRAGDYRAARKLATTALGSELDVDARVALLHALRFSGRGIDAVAVVESREDGDRADDAPVADALVIARAEVRQFVLDDVDGALSIIDEARRVSDSSVLATQRLVHLGFAGRYAHALPAMETAMSDPLTSDVERSRMSAPFTIGLTFAGRAEQARREIERAISIAPRVTDRLPFTQSEAVSAAFFNRYIGGWSLAGLPALGTVTDDSLVQIGLALPLVRRGDASAALAEFDKAIAACAVHDPSGFMVFALACASASAAATGLDQRSIALADQIERTPWRISRHLEPEIRRLLLWPAYLRGGVAQVSREGHALIERYERDGLYNAELTTRHMMFRFGVRDVAPTDELLSRNDGPAADALGELFSALRASDDVGMMRASERFESYDALVFAAEAAAEACRVARGSGRPAAARTAALRVRSLIGAGNMRMVPLLRDWSFAQQLTSREREIVALAEQLLTNREIAARLELSKRTVEGHLHRAYTKLGVADRRLLRDA